MNPSGFGITCYLSSIGMDAQVSYAFHSERKLHPEKFKNQLINQVLLLFLDHLCLFVLFYGDILRPV